ncbi:MAG: phosphopantetheine-binding protein [Spirochaetales bacterium]|nr:phosphopantetheine-binding protein [Spirochaetales bacterium]
MKSLELQLKELVIESLDLEDMTVDDIPADAALFGDDLGLDSIDALELGIAIKKKFNITLSAEDEENRKHFYSINTLKDFVTANRA